MEALEYYKLKDELSGLIKSEIASSVSNERDLQQKYIGAALKVAASGIALAIVALSIFGVKSMSEISTAIDKIPDVINQRADREINERFNKRNPVADYEVLLLDSVARSLAVSLTMLLEKNPFVFIDERTADLIGKALRQKEVKNGTKLSLIHALSHENIRGVPPTIDQEIMRTFNQMVTEREVSERSLAKCVDYFSSHNPERYSEPLNKIFVATTLPKVRIAIARFAMKLDRGYGIDLVKSLEDAPDQTIQYLVHMRNLKNSTSFKIDRELIFSVLSSALSKTDSDGEITLPDVIDHLNFLNDNTDQVSASSGAFLDIIREFAMTKGLAPAVRRNVPQSTTFRFFTSDGIAQSAAMDRNQFGTILNLVGAKIREKLKQSNGKIDDTLKAEMQFWFPRTLPSISGGERKATNFLISPANEMVFQVKNQAPIMGNSLGDRATLTTQKNGGSVDMVLKWTSSAGDSHSALVTEITAYRAKDLALVSIWDRWSSDNDFDFP